MFVWSVICSFDPYNNFKSTEKLSNLLKVTQLVNFWDRTQVQESHVLNSTVSAVPWYYFLFSLPLSFLLTLSFSLLSLSVSLSLFTSLFLSIPIHFSFPFSLFSSLPSFLPSFLPYFFIVSIKTLQWLTNCSYNLYCSTSLHTHTHIESVKAPGQGWNGTVLNEAGGSPGWSVSKAPDFLTCVSFPLQCTSRPECIIQSRSCAARYQSIAALHPSNAAPHQSIAAPHQSIAAPHPSHAAHYQSIAAPHFSSTVPLCSNAAPQQGTAAPHQSSSKLHLSTPSSLASLHPRARSPLSHIAHTLSSARSPSRSKPQAWARGQAPCRTETMKPTPRSQPASCQHHSPPASGGSHTCGKGSTRMGASWITISD